MSVSRSQVKAALAPPFPEEIIDNLLDEYQKIKQQFALRKFSPSELNGGRFAECVIRMIEYIMSGVYTPFGPPGLSAGASDTILNKAHTTTTLPETIRFYINRLTRVLLDVRNKRDVAHVGGKVNPNFADSLLVCQCADWILTDMVREYARCDIDTARKLVANINEIKIPIVAEVNGFIRVQNTNLRARDQALVVLYYKRPDSVRDTDIAKWILYTKVDRFQKEILPALHFEALVHYAAGFVDLLPKGERWVEGNISLDLLI